MFKKIEFSHLNDASYIVWVNPVKKLQQIYFADNTKQDHKFKNQVKICILIFRKHNTNMKLIYRNVPTK
jgi:hypothetical protein